MAPEVRASSSAVQAAGAVLAARFGAAPPDDDEDDDVPPGSAAGAFAGGDGEGVADEGNPDGHCGGTRSMCPLGRENEDGKVKPLPFQCALPEVRAAHTLILSPQYTTTPPHQHHTTTSPRKY